jgi:dTDP-4-dehydrorhamnose 3,5-epimerase-like enzyme
MAETEKADESQWQGLGVEARAGLEARSYKKASLPERLAGSGVDAGELLSRQGLEAVWIPGVEIFRRTVYQQRHRGYFAELARGTEGILHEIGLWPRQWATALMFAGTAKGFHIHPPHIPEGQDAVQWMQRLFVNEPKRYDLRPYDKEQWDVMFMVRGISEMFLIDERAGMPRRKMRFFIEGDQMPGANNVAVVIPPGVAHALRPATSAELIMVYGTSTVFQPDFEGRIRSGVEQAFPPEDWEAWWGGAR